MNFDRFTLVFLLRRPDAPTLSAEADAQLQDAHMAFLAASHNAGELLVAGPVLGDENRDLRGVAILGAPPDRALQLLEQDPAVQAGRYSLQAVSWAVPGNFMHFSPGQLPRSMREAQG